MEQLLLNLYNNISSLSFVDILFIVMFVVLIILVISLVSLLKHNNDNVDRLEATKEIPKLEEKIEIAQVKENNEVKKEPIDELDLSSITKELENIGKATINLTPYEEEQEEKAIISYDELVKTRSDLKINYQEEEQLDEVLVKKVDMTNMTSELDMSEVREKIQETNKAPVVISYEKEEAFLESLKKLQQMLNS